MAEFPTFKGRDRDLDLGSGHTVHLYLHWNQRNFSWTDRRTFETHFIRSTWRSPLNKLIN